MLWVCALSKAETGQHWGNERALKTDLSTSGPDSMSWEMLCILTDTSPNLMPQGRDTRAANGRSRSGECLGPLKCLRVLYGADSSKGPCGLGTDY